MRKSWVYFVTFRSELKEEIKVAVAASGAPEAVVNACMAVNTTTTFTQREIVELVRAKFDIFYPEVVK